MRHGRTEWNAQGRFQGWADPPLDSEGRRQAEECGARLATQLEGAEDLRVFSSDRIRALDTARAVAAALGGLDVNVDDRLREVDVGGWEGLTRSEAEARFPAEYERWSRGEDVARGGGETVAESGRRVAGCIAGLSAGGGHLIVVGHGLSLESAMGMLAEQGLVTLHGEPLHLGNGQFVELPFAAVCP